ncbi:hypothetical protein HYALB_00009725 [Hymenoscyphus albidus]|uniref:Uncharacterized protein n=1 Tax=Hymenoscyphus albidus TaxID=595503 RepID=A0A9N9Q4A3_9HELO|nr:hypothetical protein HYALB_00009725 [Hymenoscyphus albidus]
MAHPFTPTRVTGRKFPDGIFSLILKLGLQTAHPKNKIAKKKNNGSRHKIHLPLVASRDPPRDPRSSRGNTSRAPISHLQADERNIQTTISNQDGRSDRTDQSRLRPLPRSGALPTPRVPRRLDPQRRQIRREEEAVCQQALDQESATTAGKVKGAGRGGV